MADQRQLSRIASHAVRASILVLMVLITPLAVLSNRSVDAAESGRRPNVLMIIVDDLRPMLGCYGAEHIQTPNIDRLATRSVVFDRAYCQIAKCGPSRLSLLTGLRPDQTRVYDHRIDDLTRFRETYPDHASLPRCFTVAGYYTKSFGKVYHDGWDVAEDWAAVSMPGRESEMLAIADLDAISKVAFEKRAAVPTKIQSRDDCPVMQAPQVPDDALFAGQMTNAAIATLRTVKDQPFLLAVGFRRPHLPFVAPERYFDLYSPQANWLPENREPPRDAPIMAYFNSDAYVGFARRVGLVMPDPPQSREQAAEWGGFELRSYQGVPYHGEISDELQLRLRQAYMACVSYVDAQIGRLIDELTQLDLDDSTFVILCSDHGWHLGEHASWSKMTNYELDTRVPLLISGPKIIPQRTKTIVELIDLYPTLCDFCELKHSANLAGKSLQAALVGAAEFQSRPAYSQFARFKKYMGRAVRTERFRYVEWREMRSRQIVARELYDHDYDPHELQNVAERGANSQAVERLAELLSRVRTR
ncbi:MAG: sulfatase [Planctomycetaceae bacterium]|nr:sulfatase [Planctomycetales bacterium]MCB9926632.1 sulfatase [Planctomycetaceae bacterium]